MGTDELSLRMPAREPSIELLAQLEPESQGEFARQLLDVLWDSHDAGELPKSVTLFLRDWIAHAHAATSPVVQSRLADARHTVTS